MGATQTVFTISPSPVDTFTIFTGTFRITVISPDLFDGKLTFLKTVPLTGFTDQVDEGEVSITDFMVAILILVLQQNSVIVNLLFVELNLVVVYSHNLHFGLLHHSSKSVKN
jgi:hypothetical protein